MTENIKLAALRSYYSQQAGGLITLDDDVLGIVSQVREEFDFRIGVELDPVTGWYHLVEYCEDGTERLIFSVASLDGEDVMDRLRRSDSTSRAYQDPYDAAEREQDELQSLNDERAQEKLRESGEMLAHALKKDGVMPRLPLQVYIPNGVRSLDA